MFLSGYVFAFVIGVGVGFVFSNIILFGNRLDQSNATTLTPIGLRRSQWGFSFPPLHAARL